MFLCRMWINGRKHITAGVTSYYMMSPLCARLALRQVGPDLWCMTCDDPGYLFHCWARYWYAVRACPHAGGLRTEYLLRGLYSIVGYPRLSLLHRSIHRWKFDDGKNIMWWNFRVFSCYLTVCIPARSIQSIRRVKMLGYSLTDVRESISMVQTL